MEKVCLTTFVYGERYIAYIPFLIFSCTKAYPEYDIIIFVYGHINEKIKTQISNVSYNNNKIKIIENAYSEFKVMTPLLSKTIRWLLWDEDFQKYDYLYTVDIDMLYIKEPILLHKQHICHMNTIGLPFSNIKRKRKFNFLKLYDIGKAYKELGIFHALKCIGIIKNETKLTGLHFVKVKEYYTEKNLRIISQSKNKLIKKKYLSKIYFPNNEIYLSRLVDLFNFDLNKIPLQKNSTNMLNPNNPEREEFRPHHGIHLGCLIDNETLENSIDIFKTETYKNYIQTYKNEILTDTIFLNLIEESPPHIKSIFNRLNNYFDITHIEQK